jgi:cytochrome c oxidase subunit 2
MNLNVLKCYCDVAESWQIGIQDPATPYAEGMYFFHTFLVSIFCIIGVLVCWILYYILKTFEHKKNINLEIFTHSSLLEIIWTIFPAVILLIIAVPSFSLLYSLDEIIDPEISLKIIGHQWYWSYEISDFSLINSDIEFDSYMINSDDLTIGAFRLLEVDNRIILPINTHIRLLITAADVLHCWAIPSFGIKIDACPGRLNQASLFIKREGTFYGQCSEICGVNHGFMPIVIRAVSPDIYSKWGIEKIITQLEN